MIPDGFIEGNMVVWGYTGSKNALVSKGYEVSLESKKSLSNRVLNEFKNDLSLLLGSLNGYSIQLQWYVDSGYEGLLAGYEKDTQKNTQHPWTYYVRSEIHNRFKNRLDRGALRKEKLALFISKFVNTDKSEKELDLVLRSTEKELDMKISAIGGGMNYAGFRELQKKDYFKFYRQFLNPSVGHIDIGEQWIDSHTSIMGNCLNSDGICTASGGEVFFKMDDYYHGLLILTKWPSVTHPSIVLHVTDALSSNYRITQNIYPMDIEKELQKEEKELEKLEKHQASKGNESLLVTIDKKREKIAALMNGKTYPFEVLTIFRVWERSIGELNASLAALKTSINGMGGAHYHQVNQEAQSVKIFYETIPGWTDGDRKKWRLYAENGYLTDMMPFSSTFSGSEAEPECIYDGTTNNLVGIECFKNGTPQHAVLLGMTGAGKSVAMFDLLSQTECFYDFTAIIEEGNSYGVYTQLMGSEPIIIRPDSHLTINYLDTNGLPLTDEQISSASSLCLKMIGSNSNEDINNKRLAIFSEYINELYYCFFEDWKGANPKKYKKFLLEAYAIKAFLQERGKDMTLVDAYLNLRELKKNDFTAYQERIGSPKEEDLIRFEEDYKQAKLLRNLSFGYFEPEEYPQHSNLVELLKNFQFDHHNTEEVNHLATMLNIWCADGGSYGGLFDGQTNIKIDGKIAHFELGMIPESASALKEAAGFVVSNWIRQHIMKLPRASRKRLIFEEVSRFLNISGADKILAESYAQLRKFGCWVCCVTQQYSQLKQSALRPVIFGNSKLFLIMKQNDKQDLADIAEAIGLPESAVEEIQSYTLPEHQILGEKASYMMIYTVGGKINTCGTAKIVASKELIYAASSNGDIFDKRMKALSKYENLKEGIIYEANKISA